MFLLILQQIYSQALCETMIKPDQQSQSRIIGVASCIGAQNTTCHSAASSIQALNAANILQASWDITLSPVLNDNTEKSIADLCLQIARETRQSVIDNRFFTVFGGDHSCAIGTWSGVSSVVCPESLGLIWIDAHMDAHTPETSPSGAIHGMPLACLLGEGPDSLRYIGGEFEKILPQNLVLIGIRSYEKGEAELLAKKGVKVFHMRDIQQLGIQEVFRQTIDHLQKCCTNVGVSIDLDAIDPTEAPGVGSTASHGLGVSGLLEGLSLVRERLPLVGCEIVELNPTRDIANKTAKIAIELAKTLNPIPV